jgi:hypothetical protein
MTKRWQCTYTLLKLRKLFHFLKKTTKQLCHFLYVDLHKKKTTWLSCTCTTCIKKPQKNSFLSTAPRRTAYYSDLNIWQVHVPSCNKKAATTKFHLSNSSLSAHPLKRGTPTPFMQSLSPLSFFQMSHTSEKLLLALLLLCILIFHLFLVGFCFELFMRLRKKQSWSHQLLRR